ncbi:hypothetical protein [Actinacidiphila yeochonensis]|uniref:hypothetical protein n=1 Tax=Actinacidiphila yeochonensis TaxID=89050 RepID=UPI00055FEE72|nr:hypothetical protein [Actinacidiphila yeochonensis]
MDRSQRTAAELDPPFAGLVYAEDRVALRWPLVVLGAVLPGVLAAACVAGVAIGRDALWGVAAPAFVLCSLGFGVMLQRNWPTGVRIADGELQIGAVRSTAAGRRTPRATRQNRALFACPLAGVRSLRVATDPATVQRLKRAPEFFTLSNRWGKPRTMTACRLGVLSAPFMRAALVIELDGGWGRFPRTRPAWFFPNEFGRPFRVLVPGEESLTWVVPTRHPERLRAALSASNGRQSPGPEPR